MIFYSALNILSTVDLLKGLLTDSEIFVTIWWEGVGSGRSDWGGWITVVLRG